MYIETGTDIYVNRIIEHNLPNGISIDMINSHTKADNDLSLLMQLIVTHNENDCIKYLVDYRDVFSELSVFDGLLFEMHNLSYQELYRQT